jgi:hypothetical protein
MIHCYAQVQQYILLYVIIIIFKRFNQVSISEAIAHKN